ncbi:TonB-dependent receptor [Granulicella sp. dw_53]|uniref:TonB-dependent receptor n=1 Tax=Granulicella sp. dw_53 TaxID=2719792 RepID=UPI001BD69C71|nr:TonB-dependent receptor [Granulicella sp. dw_53]
MKLLAAAAGIAALTISHAQAQNACRGTTLTGIIRDTTSALIPEATLTLDGTEIEKSGVDGRFRFACVSNGPHHLSTAAPGFAKQDLSLTTPHTSSLDLVLRPEDVETQVDVNGDEAANSSPASSGPTQTISGNQLQLLADDPDDLLRELQQLAAAGGGNPSNTTIAVDGFQDTSKLPPKSTIAYIRVNPDQFSAEYREPPFDGGRVEVYTKPGQSAYHGALFTTNGSPWENARDPFSTSKASIGKQRYGFELTGPIRKKGSDFSVTLEHRSIDNFAVVNAVTLDSGGTSQRAVSNVATPQRLWIGTARIDWQLGPKNTFMASYSPNVNHLQNVGVGGTTLAESGYDSQRYEHVLRLSDITTASSHLMHEARLSLRWDGETDAPATITPQVQVAGAFTGGGTTLGPQHLREFNVEAVDDAIFTTKKHTIKIGTQWMMYRERQQLTTNFNGTYTFGGGTAPVLDANGHPVPGQSTTISGLEQYRRALLHLPGGTPTAFSNVAGTPEVDFTLIQNAVFIQDDWNVGHGVHIAAGVRYFLQNNPTVLNSLTPRAGILWSPTKKGTWTLHAHGGMFSGRFGKGNQAEVQREDGVARITSTIYNPTYGDPFADATPIHSIRQFSPHISNLTWGAGNIGGTRMLPRGWNLSVDYYIGRIWNDTRSANINSPLNGIPTGPRPGAPNLNVLQMQNSGQGRINATFVGIEQHTLKHLQLFFGGVRVNLVDDTDDSSFFTPQSSTSNAGEFARRTNQPMWNLFGNGTLAFPKKIQLSGNFHAGGAARYNITTGFDNNGDGNFNDRPQYATPGTPSAIATPYGLLVATGGAGVFPRNMGVLPWQFYLDTNLQRTFGLTHNAKAEHQQTLTVNLRSSNVLNHTNVTGVGGVLGSPLFGVPFSADNGRRVEAGLRYSF